MFYQTWNAGIWTMSMQKTTVVEKQNNIYAYAASLIIIIS